MYDYFTLMVILITLFNPLLLLVLYKCTRTRTLTHTHARTHAHTHTHTRTHTHTYDDLTITVLTVLCGGRRLKGQPRLRRRPHRRVRRVRCVNIYIYVYGYVCGAADDRGKCSLVIRAAA